MKKSLLMGVITTLAMSLFVVAATTTSPFNILPVNADPDEKSKAWESEDTSEDTSVQLSREKANDECKRNQ
jgi:hypothetical protein